MTEKSANIWICNFVIANRGVFEDSGVMVIKYETRVRHRLMTHPLLLSFISYFLSQNRELIPSSRRSKDRLWQKTRCDRGWWREGIPPSADR